MNVLPRLKLLNALMALTLPAVTLAVGHLQPKGMSLHQLVKGLNPNRQSVT
jgi:hypothetical protein